MLFRSLDFASVDVSFISLTKVLPAARELLSEQGEMVCLIKPQFEAGREKVGKKGVVREAKVHHEVIAKIFSFAQEIGFGVMAIDFSPIKGPEGNIEYLIYLQKDKIIIIKEEAYTLAESVVNASHKCLQGEEDK